MAKTTKKGITKPAVEVLEADPPEVALVAQASLGLVAWLQGLATFFRTARDIEQDAVARLARMKALAVPTTVEEDAAVRQAVLDDRDARKAATAHWDPITGLLSKVHRMTTAGRSRATDPLEASEAHGTRLHTTYVDNEKRRAAQAADIERRRLEAEAQRDRDAKLAEFEAAALAAEESSPELSAREQKFVEFHSGLMPDGTRRGAPNAAIAAAHAAGYAKPNEAASRLIASDKIRAAIAARQSAATMRTQIEVMKEMAPFVDEQRVEDVGKPALNKGDSESWSAACVDLEAFRDAAFEGGYGIPRSIFVVDPAALNREARSLMQNIERWPGIKATKNTTVRR